MTGNCAVVNAVPGNRERREMRRKYAGLLLAMFMLAACALPSNPPQAQPATSIAVSSAAPAATDAAISSPAPLSPSAASVAAPTSLPATSALPAATTAPVADVDELSRIASAIPQPRDQVKLAEALKGIGPVSSVARTTPLDVKVGDVETFWVANFADHTNAQLDAKLRYAGPVVLMYIDTKIEADVDRAAIEQSAREFEQMIYPRDREL